MTSTSSNFLYAIALILIYYLFRFLILGTDGLWDDLSEDEAVQIVFRGMQDKRNPDEIAKLLVQKALSNAAKESGMTLDELLQLPVGRARRSRHDDTTAVVLIW